MFCVSRNAYKMIIFAHSKCKRYENRKIQGVALPKKERNGQEWKSSHHGTHHGEQDYGAVLLQVVLHSIALESSCQPIGGQEQGSRGRPTRTSSSCCFPSKRLSMCLWKRERTSRLRMSRRLCRAASRHRPPFSPSWTSISVNSAPMRASICRRAVSGLTERFARISLSSSGEV